MPITYDEGDYATVKLDVPNTDDTTEVTLRVWSPSGVLSTPLVQREDDDTWFSQVYVDEPGHWRVVWTVDGDGQGVEGDKLRVRPSTSVPPTDGERLYATTADYARYTGDVPPDDALQALYAASRDLDNVLIGALYETDDDEYPARIPTRRAFMRATCAQAVWVSNGGADEEGALGQGIGQLSIGSISMTAMGGSGSSANNSWGGSGRTFSPAGLRILQEAGILPIRPYVVG